MAPRPAAEIVPLRRRPVWVVSLLAAALGVIVYVIGSGGGSGSGNSAEAKQLRKEALAACDAKNWDACESKLDQAKKIDREGESDARVIAARDAIAQARRAGGDR
jgi:hypothetical protein